VENEVDVTTASLRKEAAEKYTFIKSDIIIIDHEFLEMSSIEVIKRLRAMSSTQAVIAITSTKTDLELP
jgi:CheY-like chemotaxis protein